MIHINGLETSRISYFYHKQMQRVCLTSLNFTISPPSEAHLTGVISAFEDLLDRLFKERGTIATTAQP